MRRYRFEVLVTEGSDEFWEMIGDRTGCDEVLDNMRQIFDNDGSLDVTVRLIEYKDDKKI